MYQITDSTLKSGVYSAFTKPTREFQQRLSFGEGTGANFLKQISFENGITKIEISQEGNSDSNGLVLGSCCASSCVAEFYNPDKTYNYNGKTLFVECGIKYPVEITCSDVKNGYYNTEGIWKDSDIHYSISTNIFFVSEGDKFVYKGRGELGVASVIWYDSQMNFLSSEEYASETDNRATTVTVEAPNKAAYARFQSFNFGSPYITFFVAKENESFFYIPCGYYKVDRPETDDDWRTVKVTAYDAVDDMTDKWNTGITFPSNAYALLENIAEKHNLELDIESDVLADLQSRTVTEEEAVVLTAYTEREVCGFLAGLVGTNARVNTVGKFAVRRYQYAPTDDFDIPANVQWQNGFKKTAEEEFMIHSVTSGIDDAVFTAGTGAGISFANPIITEDEITAIYGLYAGISFQPSSCEWRGNPCVECGDTVIVSDKNGNSYTVFVASQDIDLTGGLSMHTHCPSGDADISFDTVDERTRAALNRQYTALQQAIINATNAINGAVGGYYEILDSDNDGNPDGWLIKQNQDGTGGLIRANYEGIGFSNDGGVTYRTAITYDGINADAITTGKLKAERIDTSTLVVGETTYENLDSLLDAVIDTAIDAEELANDLKVAGFCVENDVTYVDGSKIFAGSIASDSVAANAITSEKIAAGAITTDKLNVGWSGTNCVGCPADDWQEYQNKHCFSFSNEGTNYLPKINLSIRTEGTYAIIKSPYFFVPSGATVIISFKSYVKTTSSASNYLEVTLEKKGETTGTATVNTKTDTANQEKAHYIDHVVQNSGYYCITVASFGNYENSYITDFEVYVASKGEVIVNGIISSVDGNTYFDLDNSILATNDARITGGYLQIGSDDYYTKIQNGEITQHYKNGDSAIGGLVPVGTTDKTHQALYYCDSDGISIGYLSSSVFTPISQFATSGIKNSVKTKSETTHYSGFEHTRLTYHDDGTYTNEGTIKCGVGQNVNMWSGYKYNTASLELSRDGNIVARLDVSESWGSACGVISVNSANGRSAPLELGSSDMWFDGKGIIRTLQAVLDKNGLDWIN